jgi:hypothetical protein
VHRCRERRQTSPAEELQLVEQEGRTGPMLGGRGSDRGEQFHDVGLDVARVSNSGDCLHVDVEPPGAVLVHGKGEGAQHAERSLGRGTHSPTRAESTQRAVAEVCHQQRKVVILIALKDSGADPAMLAGHDVRLVEHDRLPDTAQSIEDKAARGLAGAKTLERNSEVLDLGVSPDQARRAGAGAGWVRVLVWVHVSNLI